MKNGIFTVKGTSILESWLDLFKVVPLSAHMLSECHESPSTKHYWKYCPNASMHFGYDF